MDINQRKEQFSRAFIHAIATVAGYTMSRPEVDDDSIDMTLAARGGAGTSRRPRLDIQIKCTQVDDGDEENFVYDLKLKNYNDLKIDTIVPRILVIVLVPDQDVETWLEFTKDETRLRRTAYWCSLCGAPETTNQKSVRVSTPRTNLFSPANLITLMERANRGEPL